MAPRTDLTIVRDPDEVGQTATLGRLRLRHVDTNEIILIPTPSNDPNDPLNWGKRYRVYLAIVVCLAMLMCNFLAAGPTVAIVQVALTFKGVAPTSPTFSAAISSVAYFFTTTALAQGVGNLFWMPLILKFGRRPMYLISFTGYFAVTLWAGFAQSYASELVARIFMGFFSGTGECLAPLTISDIFFLHERGLFMAMYTASLSAGVSGGIIISGLITIKHSWRKIHFVAAAIIGALLILVFLTFPETAFSRRPVEVARAGDRRSDSHIGRRISEDKGKSTYDSHNEIVMQSVLPCSANELTGHENATMNPKKSASRRLAIFSGTFVQESYWKMFYRPVVLLVLPGILWATLVMSVTIGFLVAISSNFASAFSEAYGFAPWQAGLCFVSGFIGTMLGIFFGGTLSDAVADFFTRRNGGIRLPEMRLPAITIGLIYSPVALVLYGVGIDQKLHWMVPTIGLGLLSFAVAQATNVSVVYVIDSYRPIAGETVVTQLAFKSCFGFLLSFYTNPWIAQSGYAAAFGEMAAISGGVLLLWIPFYMFGHKIRQATLRWHVLTHLIGWSQDREVGE